jgi:hypothetical protein
MAFAVKLALGGILYALLPYRSMPEQRSKRDMSRYPNSDPASSRGQIAWRSWLRWYLGTLILGLALSFGLAAVFPIHPMRCVLLYCSLLFSAAAIDRPRAAFLMIRNVRWFAFIREDFVVRRLMLAIAFWMACIGLFLPRGSFT